MRKVLLFCFIISIDFVLIFSQASPDEKYPLRISDFDILLDKEIILIGDNFDQVKEKVESIYGSLINLEDVGWNIVSIGIPNKIRLFHIAGYEALMGVEIKDTSFVTSRGISVGDDIQKVYDMYEVNSNKFSFITKNDSILSISQKFNIDDKIPEDNLVTYFGEPSKVYTLTFEINENNIVSAIIINQTYS